MKQFFKALEHFADFGGRARRKEFWFFVLFNFIGALVAIIIDAATGFSMDISSSTGMPSYGPFYMTYVVAMLLPGLAVAVRRLHDLGKSGWWLLISLIPLVGGIWLIDLFCTEGMSVQNRYGANPKSGMQYFPERRRGKSVAVAFIVGAAAAMVQTAATIVHILSQYGNISLPWGSWISIVSHILMLLFGVFYLPADNSGKTASRRNIAFVFLAVAALLYVFQLFSSLFGSYSIVPANIIWMLQSLSLLALAVLMLLKSGQKNIKPVSVMLIAFTALGIVMMLYLQRGNSFSIPPLGTILNVAFILLAAHCLRGKTADEEEEPLAIEPRST